jgi:hypothetical protein
MEGRGGVFLKSPIIKLLLISLNAEHGDEPPLQYHSDTRDTFSGFDHPISTVGSINLFCRL